MNNNIDARGNRGNDEAMSDVLAREQRQSTEFGDSLSSGVRV
jgi:hypothetical protein